MRRYLLAVALPLVVVPLAVVVSEEVPNDRPAFCLLINGVSWLPVDSLPEALWQRVTDETPTQVMNGVTFVPIKRFVEAQGGTVGWDGSAGLVMVEFEDQVLRLKALDSESFWQTDKVRPLMPETTSETEAGPGQAMGATVSVDVADLPLGLQLNFLGISHGLRYQIAPGARYKLVTCSIEGTLDEVVRGLAESAGTTAYKQEDSVWRIGTSSEWQERIVHWSSRRKGSTGHIGPQPTVSGLRHIVSGALQSGRTGIDLSATESNTVRQKWGNMGGAIRTSDGVVGAWDLCQQGDGTLRPAKPGEVSWYFGIMIKYDNNRPDHLLVGRRDVPATID